MNSHAEQIIDWQRQTIEDKDSVIAALKDGRKALHELVNKLAAENAELRRRLAAVQVECERGIEDFFRGKKEEDAANEDVRGQVAPVQLDVCEYIARMERAGQ